MLDGGAHQLVIGRMEFHKIDPMTVAIVALEHRPVLVGEKAGLHQWPTGQRAIDIQPPLGPAGMIALRPLLQRQVEAVEVGAFERRHLVDDLVGFGTGLRNHLTALVSLPMRGGCQQA